MKKYNEASPAFAPNRSRNPRRLRRGGCQTKTLEEAKELCSECIKAEIKDLQDKLKIVNNYL